MIIFRCHFSIFQFVIISLFYAYCLNPLLADESIKICTPSAPPDCGVRINKNIEEDRTIQDGRYFKYSYTKSVEKSYEMSVSWDIGLNKNSEASQPLTTQVSTNFIYDKESNELEIVSELIGLTNTEEANFKLHEKKKSICKYDARGDAISEGCYFAPSSIYTLPKDELRVGQKIIDRVSVPYSIQNLDFTLNLEREFALVDYIKFENKTLARLHVQEKLVSATIPYAIKVCPKVYYTSSRILYLDINTMLPYNILSLTKVGLKGEIDTAIVIKLKEKQF